MRVAREGWEPDFVPRYPFSPSPVPAPSSSASRPRVFEPEFPVPPSKASPPAPRWEDPLACFQRVSPYQRTRAVLTPEYYSRMSNNQRAAAMQDPNYVVQAHASVQVDSPHALRHTVDALKDYCRRWGISSTGVKGDLVTRVEHEAVHGCPESRGA